jgi:tol-pal system protein YbgF
MGIYKPAKGAFDAGKNEEARRGFAKLIEKFPKSQHADNAQFWIGETYYQEKWFEKAILEYQKVIENYPKGNKVPAALLKQGLAFQKIGDTANARLILKELIKKYPQTSEGSIAKQKLKEF